MKWITMMVYRLHDGRTVGKEVPMNSEKEGPVDSADVWSVYPLLHLQEDWTTAKQHFFEPDVRLIRADKPLLQELREIEVGPLARPGVLFDDEKPKVRWLLAVRVPEGIQHVSVQDVGIDFEEWVEGAVVDSFLACLNVVRSTPATAPFRYRGKLRGATVRDVSCCYDYWEETGDPATCYWPSSFTEADLPVLSEVWSGMVKVRRLREWMSQPFAESTFTEMDAQAVKEARRQMRQQVLPPGLQELKEKGDKAYPKLEDIFRRSIQKQEEDRNDWWKEEYQEAFVRVFRQYQDKLFNSESRAGRALGIFESGIHLPPLHAFLSACLVLETLFTMDSAEVAHKMATRMTKILLPDAGIAERRESYKRIKKMYRGRSDVIHGSKSIYRLDEEVRKSAPEFAQRSLQAILRQDKLVRYYTQDEQAERAEGGLVEFLEGLDLA